MSDYNPKKYYEEFEEDFDRASRLARCLPYHVEETAEDYEYGVPNYEPKDPAEHAALIILGNMMERRGIKWELDKVDYDIRSEMMAYMRAAINYAVHKDDSNA